MEKLLEKIGLYDFFARLITGLTILVSAEVFGIIDCLHLFSEEAEKRTFVIPAVLLGGYFVGVVLEELAYWIRPILIALKKREALFPRIVEPADTEKKKRKLIGAGHEGLIETPLTHVVMSKAYALAFSVFTVINIIKAFCHAELTSETWWILKYIIAPLVLTAVFILRQYHYRARRIELIERYYEAYCGKENGNNSGQMKEEKNEHNK